MSSIDTEYRSELTSASNAAEAARKYEAQRVPKSSLGKDDFLQLLVTQMQHQDPTSPQDNNQFIDQLTQFSQLEEMTNLNKTMSDSAAYGMVGKYVYGQMQDDYGITSAYFGQVQFVMNQNGTMLARVKGADGIADVPIESILDVYDASMFDPLGGNQDMITGSALVNKNVVARWSVEKVEYEKDSEGNLILDDDGNPIKVVEYEKDEDGNLVLDDNGEPVIKAPEYETKEVSGRVTKVVADGGKMYAYVQDPDDPDKEPDKVEIGQIVEVKN